jgi:hypothetical protein
MTPAARDLAVVHRRGSRVPAFLQPAPKSDQVEVVELDSGEVVLFWDVPSGAARRFVRALRADLGGMERDELLSKWGAVEVP